MFCRSLGSKKILIIIRSEGASSRVGETPLSKRLNGKHSGMVVGGDEVGIMHQMVQKSNFGN